MNMYQKCIQELSTHIKNGLFDKACEYVKNNIFSIKNEHQLNLLAMCSNSVGPKCSPKHLLQFINQFSYQVKTTTELSTYIRSLYFILQWLIKLCEWKLIMQLKCMLLADFINPKMEKKEMDEYYSCHQILGKAILLLDPSKKANQCTELITLLIDMQDQYKPKEVLTFIAKFTKSYKQEYLYQISELLISIIIELKLDITTQENFAVLLFILEKCFVTKGQVNTTSQELDKRLLKSIHDFKESVSDVNITSLFTYLEAALFNTAEYSLNLLQKLVSKQELISHLAEITYFYSRWYEEDRKNNRICTLEKDYSMLKVYLSHLKSVANILQKKRMPTPCKCCSLDKHIRHALQLLITGCNNAVTAINHLQKKNVPVTDTFLIALHKVTLRAFDFIQILSKSGCTITNVCFAAICTPVCNLYTNLAQQKKFTYSQMLLEPCIKGLFIYKIEIEGVAENLLYFYADCLLKQEKWEQALDICAVSFYLKCKNSLRIFNIWNQALYHSKSEVSLHARLKEWGKFIESICGKCDMQLDKTSLYLLELRNYIKSYHSHVRIQKCLKNLFKLVTQSEYYDILLEIPLETLYSLKSPLSKVAPKAPSHFILHKYLEYVREYMEAIAKFSKTRQESKEIESADLYSHLGLDEYNAMISHLEEAVNMFTSTTSFKGDKEVLLQVAVCIGHELELHCFNEIALMIWNAALSLAKSLHDNEKIVHIITGLLKYHPPDVDGFIKQGVNALKKTEGNELQLKFNSALAVYYLHIGDLNNFRKAYHSATDCYHEIGGYKMDLSEAKVEQVISLGYYALMIDVTIMMDCNEVIDELHGEHTFALPKMLLRKIEAYVKKYSYHFCEYLDVMFTLKEKIIFTYYWCKLYDLAKPLTRMTLSFVRDFCLAFRVCRQLATLGQIQSDCEKNDELLETYHIMAKILQVRVCDLDGYKAQAANLSPARVKLQLKEPSFLQHTNCTCLKCNNKEYQSLVLRTFHLQALHINNTLDTITFNNFYQAVLDINQRLIQKKHFKHCAANESLLWLSIKNQRLLCNTSKLKEEIDILLDILKRQGYYNKYLFTELCALRDTLYLEDKGILPKPIPIEKCENPAITMNGNKTSLLTTPTIELPSVLSSMTTGKIKSANTVSKTTRMTAKCLINEFSKCNMKDSPSELKRTTRSAKRHLR